MPTPKPLPLELTEAEKQGLEKLIRRHNIGQQAALRGRIVLAAGNGKNKSRIAKEMNVNLETVRLWRQRWLDLKPISLEDMSIEERLEDLPRPGAPAQFTADQICKITELACEKPEENGRLISQ